MYLLMRKNSRGEKDSIRENTYVEFWDCKKRLRIYEFWQLEMAEFSNEIFEYGSQCFSAVIPNMFNDLVSLKIHWTNWRTIYVWVFQISPSLALTTIVLTFSLSNNPRTNLVLWQRNIDWMQSIELNSRIFGCNSHQLDLHVLQSRKCFY